MVDYCIVPYEKLYLFNEFEVVLMSDVVNTLGLLTSIADINCILDHSPLSWKLTLNVCKGKLSSNKWRGAWWPGG